MDRKAMLAALGLSESEFKHLLKAFRNFYGNLNPNQKNAISKLLPGKAQAIALLGGGATQIDLNNLVSATPDTQPDGSAGAFGNDGINQIANPPTP